LDGSIQSDAAAGRVGRPADESEDGGPRAIADDAGDSKTMTHAEPTNAGEPDEALNRVKKLKTIEIPVNSGDVPGLEALRAKPNSPRELTTRTVHSGKGLSKREKRKRRREIKRIERENRAANERAKRAIASTPAPVASAASVVGPAAGPDLHTQTPRGP
jgi:hypothetical protein